MESQHKRFCLQLYKPSSYVKTKITEKQRKKAKTPPANLRDSLIQFIIITPLFPLWLLSLVSFLICAKTMKWQLTLWVSEVNTKPNDLEEFLTVKHRQRLAIIEISRAEQNQKNWGKKIKHSTCSKSMRFYQHLYNLCRYMQNSVQFSFSQITTKDFLRNFTL